jgi:ligand-binding sensor domain-containing protein/signal transduction histidine kinase
MLVSAFDLSASQESVLHDFLLRSWDSQDGLPPGRVQAIAQTDDGYLWVGTSRGLARFDGVRFMVFTAENTPAWADNRITSLLVSHTGDLWIGMQDGQFARRHGERFEPVALGAAAAGIRISSLVEDRAGAIWIGTRGKGIARWQNGVCDWFQFEKATPSGRYDVTQIIADQQGRLWAIVNEQLAVFENNTWNIVTGAISSGSLQVMALAPAREGGIWVATCVPQNLSGRGALLFKLDEKGWHQLSDPCPWPQETVFTRPERLLEDGSGRLWLATFGSGIFVRSANEGWHSLNDSGHSSLVECRSLFESKGGVIWAGTTDFLLVQIRSQPVSMLHLPETVNRNVVYTTCARRDGSVWIGTDGSGACCYQNGEFTNVNFGVGTENLQVFTIYEDPQTNLWAGTSKGLYRMVDGQLKRVTLFNRPEMARALAQAVLALNQDSRRNLWVGTAAGVVRLGPDGNKLFAKAEGIDHDYIRAIEEDRSGQIWVAITDRGLYRKTGEQFERYSTTNWTGIDRIRGLHADADGALWFTTDSRGLGCLKNGKFSKWTVEDGLPTDDLITVTEDQEGNLWISSGNGIFGCPKSRLLSYQRGVSPPIVFWQLTTSDGLGSQRCTGGGQPVSARSSDGHLWFPDWHAMAVFDPEQIQGYLRKRTHPPIIEELMVDGARHLPDADGVFRLKSGAGSLEFHFTSPVFFSSEHLQFRYRLTKLDANWVNAGQRRVAYYTHLPVGKYEFQVQVGGPDGEWRDTVQNLSLEITPRFWERRWVQSIGLVALTSLMASTIWSVSRIRMRRRLAVLERQRALEEERSRIARDMHDELGARLTQISLLSAIVDGKAGNESEVRAPNKKISGLTRNVIRSLNEIVWAVRPQNDNLESLIDFLRESLRDLCDGSALRYWFSGPKNVPKIEVPANVRHNVMLACFEVVNNALKHSGGSEVRAAVRIEPSALVIEIADDGQGFPVHQGESKRSGLLHIQQRLQEIGGTSVCQTTPGEGTRYLFTVPVRLEHPAALPSPTPEGLLPPADAKNER